MTLARLGARLARRSQTGLPRIDTLGVPALVMDAAGAVLAANPAADRLVRALAGGALGETYLAIQAAARDCFPHDGRVTLKDADGAVDCDIAVVPLGGARVLVLGRVAAFERNLRDALVDSRRRYKDLVEISSDFTWETGPDGRFVFVSPQGALGWAADQLVGRDPYEFLAARDRDEREPETDAEAGPFAARRPLQDAQLWFRRADDSLACLSASVRPLYDDAGVWIGARGVCRDVTEARERDAMLARAHVRERLFGYILRAMREELDPASLLGAAASAIARALTARGTEIHRIAAPGPVKAASFGDAPPVAPSGCVAACLRRPGAVAVPGETANLLAVSTRYQGGVNGALLIWRDAALGPFAEDERALAIDAAEHLALAIEQIAAHEKLQEMSSTDALTGLLNRRSFMSELGRRHERAVLARGAGALVYCDLDNFKQVNDTHGHERGDAALREVAAILKSSTRGEDLIARLGGDEFALWLEGTDAATAERRAATLLARAGGLKVFSGGPAHPLGFSLGVALAGAGETLEQFMARADGAMYASKKRGKGQCTIAPPGGGALRAGKAS